MDKQLALEADGGQRAQHSLTKRGWTILGVAATAAVAIYGVAIPFISPAFRRICLPYVPATDAQVRNVLKCLAGRQGRTVDLGSGDGRIVLAVASETGTVADGVELNPWLVWYSRFRARRLSLHRTARFYVKNIWHTDLSLYDNVVVFGVEQMMQPLEEKLAKELRPEAAVVACRFPLPTWKPLAVVGEDIDTVWLYSLPKSGTTR